MHHDIAAWGEVGDIGSDVRIRARMRARQDPGRGRRLCSLLGAGRVGPDRRRLRAGLRGFDHLLVSLSKATEGQRGQGEHHDYWSEHDELDGEAATVTSLVRLVEAEGAVGVLGPLGVVAAFGLGGGASIASPSHSLARNSWIVPACVAETERWIPGMIDTALAVTVTSTWSPGNLDTRIAGPTTFA